MKNNLALAALASLLVACPGDSEDPQRADADAALDAVDAETPDTPDDAPSSDAPPDTAADAAVDIDFTPDPECGADWVVQVDGAIVDDAGEQVAGAKAQLCVRLDSVDGRLVCLRPEDAGDDGTFTIVAPPSARCVGGGSMRVFAPGSTLATTYCHIETEAAGGRLTLAEPIVLFETDAAEALPAYGDPDAARAVTLGGGFELPEFVPSELGFTFDESAYANLGARRVDPATEGLCFVSAEVDGLWAFRVEANVDGALDFRFPNTDGYAAGARVDLYVLGGLETRLEDGSTVSETEFVRYGAATVSEDGGWVEGRIPAFTWLGYALAAE